MPRPINELYHGTRMLEEIEKLGINEFTTRWVADNIPHLSELDQGIKRVRENFYRFEDMGYIIKLNKKIVNSQVFGFSEKWKKRKNELKKCRICNDILIPGENWRKSDIKNYNYVHAKCDDKRRKEQNNKIKNKSINETLFDKYRKMNVLTEEICDINNNKQYSNTPKKFRLWASQTRSQHIARGIEFNNDVTIDYLENLLKEAYISGCFYCNAALGFGHGKVQPNSPTLDIIDPNKKINDKNNVRVICHTCNSAKGQLTHKQFVLKMKVIAERF
jgi:hypothetical protein